MLFKAYDESAFKIIIPGFTVNGLLVRQTTFPGAAELSKDRYELHYPEIGISEIIKSNNDVAAVVVAKTMIREKLATIYNNTLDK